MYCGVLHFVSNWFCKKIVQNLNPQQLGYWSYGRTSTPGQVHALWTFSTRIDGDYHSQDGREEAPQGLPHPSTCDFIPRTQSGQIGSQHRGNWFSSHLKGQDRGQKGISCFPQSQGPEHCILPLLLVLGGQFVQARSWGGGKEYLGCCYVIPLELPRGTASRASAHHCCEVVC